MSTVDRARVVGIGETEYSADSGRHESVLAAEAVSRALVDAGLAPADVDGIVAYPDGARAEDLMTALGLHEIGFTAVPHLGGASSVAALGIAAMAVESGRAEVAVCFIARNGRSRSRISDRVRSLVPGDRHRVALEHPHGLSTPAQWYSLICRRHMHQFGTTRQQLGTVAVTMRAHAQHNDRAQMHGRPMTMEDYLASRPIADPYLLFDCCLETDGACAVVVTNAARADDLAQPPVEVLAVSEGHPDVPDDLSNRTDFFETGLTKAAPLAFGRAGISPADVDALMVYDCFTFEVIQQLEEAGFCARGEGGPFVEDGHIGLEGALPVNPHGGLLSEGHLGGMNHIAEAVRQLRGTANDRQIPGAEVVAVTGWGDLGDGAMAILASAGAADTGRSS